MITARARAASISLTIAAALTLAGCSGGSSKSDDPVVSSPAGATPAAPSATPSQIARIGGAARPKITYGTPAAKIAGYLGCLNPHPSPSDTDSVTVPGLVPVEEILCSLGPDSIDITTYATAAKQSVAVTTADALLTGFGFEGWTAEGDGWLAGTASENADAAATAHGKDIAGQIVKKIGGKVIHLGSASSATPSPSSPTCASLVGQPVGPASADGQTLTTWKGCADSGGASYPQPSSAGCYKNGVQSGLWFYVGGANAWYFGSPGGLWMTGPVSLTSSQMAAKVGCV